MAVLHKMNKYQGQASACYTAYNTDMHVHRNDIGLIELSKQYKLN
jgi:hypothetical protein